MLLKTRNSMMHCIVMNAASDMMVFCRFQLPRCTLALLLPASGEYFYSARPEIEPERRACQGRYDEA